MIDIMITIIIDYLNVFYNMFWGLNMLYNHFGRSKPFFMRYTYCQFIFLFTYDTCSCSCILLIGLKTMESVALNDVVVVEVVGVIVVFVTIDVGRQASAFNAGRVSNVE